MAKIDKKQEQIKSIDYQAVDAYIRNDSAYIGTVVNSRVDGENKQFLIVTDKQSEVVDIIQINRPGQKISCDRPIVVLSNNEDESTYIPSGFYIGGERQILVENNREVTLDTLHSRSFGNTGVQFSLYEKQQILQAALSEIDDPYKNPAYKDDLKEYLTDSVKKYYDFSYEAHKQNNSIYEKNQYAQIGVVEQELQSVLSDRSNGSFLSELKRDAVAIHQKNAEKQLQQTYEDSVDWSRSRFDRAISEEKLSDFIIRKRYYENAEQFSERFNNYIARTGLSDAIGKTNSESYRQISEVIRSEKDLLERNIARKEPISVIEERRDFIIGLSALAASHPQIIQHGSLSDTDVSDAKRGYAYYSFMPNNNLHAIMSEHRDVSRGYASEPLSYTDRMYQNMGQQDFYQYLVAKSKIVKEIINQSAIPNEYQNILNGNVQEMEIPNTQRDRLNYIGNMLKDRLGFQGNDGIDRFLQSDEFATMIRSPESLLVKKDNAYFICVDGELREAQSKKDALRPEYGIDFSRFDIHSKSSCEELLSSIKKQIQFDSLLHERPSQELREAARFIQDHIKYNETIKTAEFNSKISAGLDSEIIRYNEMTQHILNDVGSHNVRENIKLLNNVGITDVDFSKKPTAYQVIHNYESLLKADEQINNLAFDLAQKVSSSLKNSKITATPDEIYKNIETNFDKIKSTTNTREKADLILSTLSIEHKGQISRSTLSDITKLGNVVEMERILQYKDASKDLQPLLYSMKDALTSEISHLRGCDSFARDNNGSVLKASVSQNDADAISKLDIATAIMERKSQNQYDVAIDIINNQAIRNELIDKLQKSVSYSEDYHRNRDRVEVFNNLHNLSSREVETNSPINTTERALKIASAFKIQLSDDQSVKETQISLLNSSEFLTAIKDLQNRISKENFATTKADYLLNLEKFSSVDSYKTLIENLRDTDRYNISLIGDSRYLAYIQEDMRRSNISSDAVINCINQIKQEDNYVRLLTACRNIEDLSHRTVLTSSETNILKNIGSDIAFQCSMHNIGNENTQGTDTSHIVKNRLYQNMIDGAMDPNQKSAYMNRKMEIESDAITSASKTLVDKLDIVFKDSKNITAGISVPLKEGLDSSRHQFYAYEVIRSDKSAEVLREDMVRTMQQNKNYNAYLENNNHGETIKQIECIERELQFKRDCEKTALYMIDEYHSKAHGLSAKKYSKCESCEISRLEMLQSEIINLEQKKALLEDSIKNTYGSIHKDLINEQRSFHSNQSVEAAASYAEKIIKVYSADPMERNKYRYPDESSNTLYECLRLCENLKSTNIPMSVRQDSYDVRIALAKEAQAQCVNEAVNICNKRIAEISAEFQPEAKSQITPSVIQAAIDTSAEKTRSASPIEQISIRSEIAKYTAMRDELNTVNSIRDDLSKSNISNTLISMAAKLNVSTYHISEQYSMASQHLQHALEDKQEFQKFEAARSAYIAIDRISEKTSHMSYAERDNTANNAFPEHKIISRNDLIDQIRNSNKPIAHSPEMEEYLRARSDLETGKMSVKILREKLSNRQVGDPMVDLNDDDRRALSKINNYNQAIENLKQYANEVRELSLEITGTKSGTKIIAQEMYTPIDLPHIEKYVQQYAYQETPKTLIDVYKLLTEEKKLEITNNVISAIENTDDKNPYVWPNENAKLALLSMSEKGIDKTLSAIGDEISAMNEANNVIEFYKRNIKNLSNDNDVESKQILAECERLSSSITDEQDSKHKTVMKAFDDAKNTYDEFSM